MIFIVSLIAHIVTLFRSGCMEDPGGLNPGKCCICGKQVEESR